MTRATHRPPSPETGSAAALPASDAAPHWREVAERTGQPIDERVMQDITDPRWSTWPACAAVKAAGLQGPEKAERYLRRMRRAIFTERAQAQRANVQRGLARDVPGLDVERFEADLGSRAAEEAFRQDLTECAAYRASGFPTMLFRPVGAAARDDGILVGGFRPLATYERVLAELAPGLERQSPRTPLELLSDHGPLTTRELVELTGRRALREELDAGAAAGGLSRTEVRSGGELWSLGAAGHGRTS